MSGRAYELTAAARLDFLRIWNYLAENASIDVADKISADIESAIKRLVQSPGLGHARSDLTARDVRFYLIHSYLIVYDAHQKPLHIVRVLHARQDVKGMLEE